MLEIAAGPHVDAAIRRIHVEKLRSKERAIQKPSGHPTMKPDDDELRNLRISPGIFERLMEWGWINRAGRSKEWFHHRRPEPAES